MLLEERCSVAAKSESRLEVSPQVDLVFHGRYLLKGETSGSCRAILSFMMPGTS